MTEDIAECSKEDADKAISNALGNINFTSEEVLFEKLSQKFHNKSEDNARNENIVIWADSNDTTLLWYAARNGYSTVIRLLLENGADIKKSRILKGVKFSLNEARKTASNPLIASIAYMQLHATLELLQYYQINDGLLSVETGARALLILASNSGDLCNDSMPAKVANMLILCIGSNIGNEVKVEHNGEKLSILGHAATREYHVNLVKRLLKQGCAEDHSDALYEAAYVGNAEMVKVIIENSILLESSDLCEAIIGACEAKTSAAIATIKLLHENGADINYKTDYGETAVSTATYKSNAELLKFILESGGNPLEGFDSLLEVEDSEESKACLSLLLEHLKKSQSRSDSSWINTKKDGMPILTLIAMNCAAIYIKMILDEGADIDLIDDEKHRTPLNWACSKDNENAVSALLVAGADANAHNIIDRFTPLHTAVSCGSKVLVQLLLEHGADPNMQTSTEKHSGYSALHLAVDRGNKSIVEVLLEVEDIDINIVDDEGSTPLADAVVKACTDKNPDLIDIVGLLLDKEADPDIPDVRGNTALISAVGGRNIDLIRMLVNAEAYLEESNEDGDSPLSLMAESLENVTSMEIIKIMLNSEINETDENKMAQTLKEKAQEFLEEGKDQIVAALAVLMLRSADTRKVITESPELWKTTSKTTKKKILFVQDNFEAQRVPENMLTWAILNDSPAVQILLESKDADIKLPVDWRSSLVVAQTEIGTPLRLAVNAKNMSAVTTMLNILKSVWNHQYPSSSKQRNPHPLDKLQYQDLVYVTTEYPTLMVNFFQDISLVPAYALVSGRSQAPISKTGMWVMTSKERSPASIWMEFVTRTGQFSYLNPLQDSNNPVKKESGSRRGILNRIHDICSIIWHYRRDSRDAKNREQYGFDESPTSSLKVLDADIFLEEYIVLEGTDGQREIPVRYKKPPSQNPPKNDKLSDTLMNRILVSDDTSHAERDVEAFFVPVPHIASYAVLLACVRSSDKLRNPLLFDNPVMAAVVQLHWRLYALHTHIGCMLVYLVLLMDFIVLIVYFDTWTDMGGAAEVFGWLLQGLKLSIALYFCRHELKQWRQEETDDKFSGYTSDVWNLIDMGAYILIFAGFWMQVYDPHSVNADGVHSIVALLLWFKLLYFMRPFRSFGPMVNLIFEVIFDMKVFLIILLIVMIGFGNAFYVILGSRSTSFDCDEIDPVLQDLCEEHLDTPGAFDNPFRSLRSAFSYMLGTYEFSDLDEGPLPVLLSCIWALFMIVVAIVLLNLLIAILSESYNRISARQIPSWRLEQARVVVNMFSILSDIDQQYWHRYLHDNPWLQVLMPKKSSNDDIEHPESITDQFETMQHYIQETINKQDGRFDAKLAVMLDEIKQSIASALEKNDPEKELSSEKLDNLSQQSIVSEIEKNDSEEESNP